MYGMDQMEESGDDSVAAKLQVLDEIKALMDQRLGGKLGDMSKPKGLEVSSMKVIGDEGSPGEEMSESPAAEEMESKMGMSDDDLMKLKMARQKMLG